LASRRHSVPKWFAPSIKSHRASSTGGLKGRQPDQRRASTALPPWGVIPEKIGRQRALEFAPVPKFAEQIPHGFARVRIQNLVLHKEIRSFGEFLRFPESTRQPFPGVRSVYSIAAGIWVRFTKLARDFNGLGKPADQIPRRLGI
jgi:hypothetical protein